MPGEVIEHPAPGWNELPHEPGTYAWWDGQCFTTIVFRANDHWEYVTDWQPPPPQPSRQHNPNAWIGLWIAIGNMATMCAFGFFLGPASIVLGGIGLDRADRRSERVASITAIALGSCGFLLGLAVLWAANESM